MDSERRHELETNDLKEFLDNFKDFWDKHGNKVLIVLCVGALAYAGPRYYSQWKEGKANEAANALTAATTPDQLLAVADEHDMVRDEATRRAADLLLGTLREAKIGVDDQAAEKTLSRAESAYTALAQRGSTVPYQLIGNEGLAKIAVMKGEWEAAESAYKTMIELAGDTYQVHAARAEASIEELPKLRSPIAFSEPRKIEIEEADPSTDGSALPGPALPGLELPGLDLPEPFVPATPGDTPAPEPSPTVPDSESP